MRDWYLWTTTPSDAEYVQDAEGSPLLASLVTNIGGTGHMGSEEIDRMHRRIDADIVNTVGPDRARQTDRVQTIGFMDWDTLTDILTGLPPTAQGEQVTREDVERWDHSTALNARTHVRYIPVADESSALVRNVLASPAAEAALRDYVDERIASHLGGPCARLTPETGLLLPRFTSLFNVDFYVLPLAYHVVEIMASIESPEIERLLASAGA